MKKYPFLLLAALASLTFWGSAQNDRPATVVELASSAPEFSTLVTAVDRAGLVETLSAEEPFTVFAPTDEAFTAALEALGLSAEELLASETLPEILTYHVVPGAVLAEEVLAAVEAGGGEFRVATVNGAELVITVVDGAVKINDVATVTATDLMAGNGVVHVIDAVLLPPTE